MKDINIDNWVGCCKVRAFNWIDKENIYVNVQYFSSGSSISKPPVFDKSVLITANESGYNVVENFLSSLVEYISKTDIRPNMKTVLTF